MKYVLIVHCTVYIRFYTENKEEYVNIFTYGLLYIIEQGNIAFLFILFDLLYISAVEDHERSNEDNVSFSFIKIMDEWHINGSENHFCLKNIYNISYLTYFIFQAFDISLIHNVLHKKMCLKIYFIQQTKMKNSINVEL